jgi:hypothetical protein
MSYKYRNTHSDPHLSLELALPATKIGGKLKECSSRYGFVAFRVVFQRQHNKYLCILCSVVEE